MSSDDMTRRDILKAGLISVIGAGAIYSPLLMHDGKMKKEFGEWNGSFSDEITLMTYNIANARGTGESILNRASKEKKQKNLDKIFSVIQGSEIIGLNEVFHDEGQAEYLARKLKDKVRKQGEIWGGAYLIEGKHADFPFYRFGNALISRYPFTHYSVEVFGKYFGRISHEFKGFIDATIDLGEFYLDVVVTHLHSKSEKRRLEETEVLLDLLGKKKNPYILMGDLNALPESEVVKKFEKIAKPLEKYILTHHSQKPIKKLDYIFASSSLEIFNPHLSYPDASDHLPLGCYLKRK